MAPSILADSTSTVSSRPINEPLRVCDEARLGQRYGDANSARSEGCEMAHLIQFQQESLRWQPAAIDAHRIDCHVNLQSAHYPARPGAKMLKTNENIEGLFYQIRILNPQKN